ncbi:DJ-1/PfpI family protein, partial [Alkaliphilus pronyensis]
MKILLLLAKGVELIEASAFIDVFGWNRHYNQIDTEIITCGFKREILSTFSIPIRVDLLIDEIVVDEYDALAIPGGFGDYGFYEEAFDEKFLDIVREFKDKGKLIASICVGALPIGKSGILEGKKATTYHLMGKRRQKQLEAFGVNVVNEPVVIDVYGKIKL